jgi:hypothetical protein
VVWGWRALHRASALSKAQDVSGSSDNPECSAVACCVQTPMRRRKRMDTREVAIQTDTGIVVMIDGKKVRISEDESRAERSKGI